MLLLFRSRSKYPLRGCLKSQICYAYIRENPPSPLKKQGGFIQEKKILVEPQHLATVFNVWALGTMPLLLNRLLSIDPTGSSYPLAGYTTETRSIPTDPPTTNNGNSDLATRG
jgi:hypothetical protein